MTGVHQLDECEKNHLLAVNWLISFHVSVANLYCQDNGSKSLFLNVS